MTTSQQELIQTFEALPAEAQRQALNFIAFLYQTYKPDVALPPKPKIGLGKRSCYWNMARQTRSH